MPLVVGVLVIAGIAVGAATLTSAETVGGAGDSAVISPPSPEEQIGGGERPGGQGDGNGSVESTGSFSTMTTCVDPLDSSLGTLLMIAALLGLMGLIYARYNFAISLFLGWTIAPPMALAYFMLTDCGSSQQYTGGGGVGGFGSAGESLAPSMQLPPWAIGLFVGGVLLVSAVVLYRSASEDELVVEQDGEEEEPDLGQFAAAAGRAADRIEDHNVDVDNAVYTAWLEMTGLLKVDDPETYAPYEFANAAIDAGMSSDDVEELTTLFNEVRYGDKDASVREDPALDVLRNIESEYETDDTVETDATGPTDRNDGTNGGTDR